VYEFAQKELIQAGMHVNTTLIRKFNTEFKKDDKGKTREWRTIEGGEAAIVELHKKCKRNIDDIIESFMMIQLTKLVTEEPEEDECSMLDAIKKEEENEGFFDTPTLAKKMSLTQRPIFSQDYVNST
jgi:hypothetical protein